MRSKTSLSSLSISLVLLLLLCLLFTSHNQVLADQLSNEDILEHLKQKDQAEDFPLSQLTYDDIIKLFTRLAKDYPDYIRVYDAAEQMADMHLPKTRCFTSVQSERACKFIYAEMTNFNNPAHVNFTQSFFSGNFHGDEVIGPNVVAYLARYILEQPRLDILNYSYIVLLPMGNPSGYYANNREEIQYIPSTSLPGSVPTASRQIDINRDFPYDQSSKACFKTAGARVINRIFQEHLFTAAITFHGGMTAIGWPWGSTNHARSNRLGEISPDHSAFLDLGKRMSESAMSGNGLPAYPFNTLTDGIYAVGGSFEDWSYAASWESEYSPKALPRTCQDISEAEMFMNDSIARSLTYLIETSNQKGPHSSTYGTWKQIDQPSKGIGHVSRNIRLTLDFIENLTPFHIASMAPQNGFKFLVKWELNGCNHVDSSKVFIRERLATNSSGTNTPPLRNDYESEESLLNDGFTFWREFTNVPGAIKHLDQLSVAIIEFNKDAERNIDLALVSSCDSQWKKAADTASPVKIPQSHFVRSRMDKDYLAQNKGFSINSKQSIIQTYGPFTIQNITHSYDFNNSDLKQSNESVGPSASHIFLYILGGLLVFGGVGSYLFYKCFKRLGMTQIDFEEIMDEEMVNSNNRQSETNNSRRSIPNSGRK